ncbi:MAG: hypothetical protein ACRDKF_05965 [Actinomycetota bacterium]
MDSSDDRITTEARRPTLRERARQAIEDGNTSDDSERLRLLEELHGELEGELERDLGEASPRR